MDVVVLVPRRPEPWRDRLWEYARAGLDASFHWARVVEGLSVDGPFNRSRALNEAAEGSDWDVAVILDADTVPTYHPNVGEAVDLALKTGKLVLPQDTFRSLSRAGTKAVLAAECAIEDAEKRWDYPNPKSSCIVVSRQTWELVGGFDERFEGWGFEDAAFFRACRALAGVERLPGLCYHLWHPRSEEKNPSRAEYQRNQALAALYKDARHDAEVMRAILAEPGGPLA